MSGDWILVDGEQHSSATVKLTSPHSTGIYADVLIPGRGKPARKQAVIAEHGKIVYVGPCAAVPKKYEYLAWEHVPVLMPGMWECHSHFFGASPDGPINMVNMTMGSSVEAGARNVRALKETLYAGFTSCVDLGGYAPELQKVIDEGLIVGPTLYGTGAALSMTGGHGDVFELLYGNVRQRLSVNAPGAEAGTAGVLLADGPDECRKAVRLNIRRGARVIKTMTSGKADACASMAYAAEAYVDSGGVASRDDDVQLQQFSDEELKTITDEAGRMGLACAAHAVGKAGILAAIRCGFAVIEHNSFADAEVIKAIKDNNVIVVAAITALRSVLDHKDQYPPSTARKVELVAAAQLQAYKDGIKAGVKFALGSDLFGGIGSVLSPGLNGNEVVYAVDAGMTPLEAIEAATANGPDTLGPQAPRSGQIRVGYDADFLALDSNPLDDITSLRDPKNIKCVWKQGKLVKAPGLDSWDSLAR